VILNLKQKGQITVIAVLLKITILLSFFLYSALSKAAVCQEYFYSTPAGQYRAYDSYYSDISINTKECPYSVILTPSEYARFVLLEEQNSQTIEITSMSIAESFTWGFGTYIGFWFLGYAIKNARMVIRKA